MPRMRGTYTSAEMESSTEAPERSRLYISSIVCGEPKTKRQRSSPRERHSTSRIATSEPAAWPSKLARSPVVKKQVGLTALPGSASTQLLDSRRSEERRVG